MRIQKYGSQPRLLENQRYTIEFFLAGEKRTFSFTSRYNPLYSTVKIIRNDFEELLSEISDDTINFSIWQASQLVDSLGNDGNFVNGKPIFAVKQYVRYKTEYELIRNILISVGKNAGASEKHLGEFKITKEVKTPDLEKILGALQDELKDWEAAIGKVITNRSAVRAGRDFVYPLNERVSF